VSSQFKFHDFRRLKQISRILLCLIKLWSHYSYLIKFLIQIEF
jgi:hypothetical protein